MPLPSKVMFKSLAFFSWNWQQARWRRKRNRGKRLAREGQRLTERLRGNFWKPCETTGAKNHCTHQKSSGAQKPNAAQAPVRSRAGSRHQTGSAYNSQETGAASLRQKTRASYVHSYSSHVGLHEFYPIYFD
jgi:hypothetical protein